MSDCRFGVSPVNYPDPGKYGLKTYTRYSGVDFSNRGICSDTSAIFLFILVSFLKWFIFGSIYFSSHEALQCTACVARECDVVAVATKRDARENTS